MENVGRLKDDGNKIDDERVSVRGTGQYENRCSITILSLPPPIEKAFFISPTHFKRTNNMHCLYLFYFLVHLLLIPLIRL